MNRRRLGIGWIGDRRSRQICEIVPKSVIQSELVRGSELVLREDGIIRRPEVEDRIADRLREGLPALRACRIAREIQGEVRPRRVGIRSGPVPEDVEIVLNC